MTWLSSPRGLRKHLTLASDIPRLSQQFFLFVCEAKSFRLCFYKTSKAVKAHREKADPSVDGWMSPSSSGIAPNPDVAGAINCALLRSEISLRLLNWKANKDENLIDPTYAWPVGDLPLGALVAIAAFLDLRPNPAARVVGHPMSRSVTLLGAHHQALPHTASALLTARSPLIRNPSVNAKEFFFSVDKELSMFINVNVIW